MIAGDGQNTIEYIPYGVMSSQRHDSEGEPCRGECEK